MLFGHCGRWSVLGDRTSQTVENPGFARTLIMSAALEQKALVGEGKARAGGLKMRRRSSDGEDGAGPREVGRQRGRESGQARAGRHGRVGKRDQEIAQPQGKMGQSQRRTRSTSQAILGFFAQAKAIGALAQKRVNGVEPWTVSSRRFSQLQQASATPPLRIAASAPSGHPSSAARCSSLPKQTCVWWPGDQIRIPQPGH